MKKNLLTATPVWREDRQLWQLNVQKDRVRRSFYSSTPGRKGASECMLKAQKWIDLIADGDPVMSEAWAAWIKNKERTVGKAGMSPIYSFANKWVLAAVFAKKRLSRITPNDWQRLLDDCAEAGLAKRTCENYKGHIMEFLRYCKDNRWTSDLPENLLIHSQKSAKKQIILQPDGIRTVFSCDTTIFNKNRVHEWYINAYRLAIITGMRRGELAGLQWQDIDEEYITINRAINSLGILTPGKNDNARRKIPLTKSAKQVLEDQRAFLDQQHIRGMWIFPSDLGRQSDPNTIYAKWKRYLASNGLDQRITFHNLRRTMISMHRKDDMPIELIKQLVGHSAAMDTFGTYGEAMDDERDITVSYMETSLQNIIGN